MRRFVCLPAGVLLCVMTLGADSRKEYDGRTQVADPLQGKWRPLKVEVANKTGKIIVTGLSGPTSSFRMRGTFGVGGMGTPVSPAVRESVGMMSASALGAWT
jgi:hypothetical protein